MKKAIIILAALALLATSCVHYPDQAGFMPAPAIEHEEYEPMPGPEQPVQLLIEPRLANLREIERATNGFYDKAFEFTGQYIELVLEEMEYNYDVNNMSYEDLGSAFKYEASKAKWYFCRELRTILYYEFGENYEQIVDVQGTLHMWWAWYAGITDTNL